MLIDPNTKVLLERKYKEELAEDVDIKVFARDIITSDEDPEHARFSQEFVKELSQISGKIKAEYFNFGDDSAKELDLSFSPTIVIGKDSDYSIQYWGVPAGQLAGSLIETITIVSQKRSGLDQPLRDNLKHIDKKILIETYFSLDSPASSQAVLLSHRMAVERPGMIMSRAVEVEEAIKKRKISEIPALPLVVINDNPKSFLSGQISKEKLLYQVVLYGSSDKDSILAQLEEEEKRKKTLADKPDYPVVLTTDNFEEALQKYPFIVIDCWAEWCAPCQMVHPIIEDLAKKYTGKIAFAKLDIDQNREIAERFRIMSIPTLLVFKDGQNVDSIIGAMPQPALEEKLKLYQE
jgi:thioredoxin 1